MTDDDREAFERRFASRSRSYTDIATVRRIDAVEFAKAAMSSRAIGGSRSRRVLGSIRRQIAGPRLATGTLALIVIGMVAISAISPHSAAPAGRPSPAATRSMPASTNPVAGSIPDVLFHTWQRPYAVLPGLDRWPSAHLTLSSGRLDVRRDTSADPSASTLLVQGDDTILVTATAETSGCAVGEVGRYHWSLDGNDTVMTLTAVRSDGCSVREQALAGAWVRADFPPPVDAGGTRAPGTYETTSFNPFGQQGASGRVSYTVPTGWEVIDDRPSVFVLFHHGTETPQSQPPILSMIALMAQPVVVAEATAGVACDALDAVPGIRNGVHEVLTAIAARSGVVSSTPVDATIGDIHGQMVELHLDASWTSGCTTPDVEVAGMALLRNAGSPSGPVIGIVGAQPMRLILLDVGAGRLLAIAVSSITAADLTAGASQVTAAMPVVQSLEFHPASP